MLGLFLTTAMVGELSPPVPIRLAQMVSVTSSPQVYQPPASGQRRRRYRKAGGSRGCDLKAKDALTLIVPQDHTAQTTSSHPTFWWYLSQELSLPLRFTLLEPGHHPIYSQDLILDKSGLVALTLPENAPPLEIGKEYRWTVSIICNRQKPSQNIFTQAWIKRVAPVSPRKLEEQKGLSCHLAYAQLGLWYEALSCSLLPSNSPKLNPLIDTDILSLLLKEIDLDDIIKAPYSPLSQKK